MPLSVEKVIAVGDIQRNYIYKTIIESLPEGFLTAYPEYADIASKFYTGGQIDLYNTKGIFPDRKTDKITKQWGGEFFTISGVDKSTRDATLEFYEDSDMAIYDFFDALKDFTGNEENQAAVHDTESKFDIGVAQVSTDKKTITNYRRLIGVKVYEVSIDEPNKEGSDTHKVTVNIVWDRNRNDRSKRGQEV